MKKYNLLSIILIVFIVLGFSTITAAAQQILANGALFTVNNDGDSVDADPGDGICADTNSQCTLRAAVEEANADPNTDIIIFSLPLPAVINLTLGQLSVTKNLSIIGPGARNLTVRRSPEPGTANFRIFSLAGAPETVIFMRRIKISNGNAGKQFGGAVNISRRNYVYMNNIAISNNSAYSGGGIANFGYLTLNRSTLNSNKAYFEGGGIINYHDDVFPPNAHSIISNTTITENISESVCGAICNNANLILANNTISHNAASVNASGIKNFSEGSVSVINTIIGSNPFPAVNALSGDFDSLGSNIITDARGSRGFSTNSGNGDQVSDNNAINPLLGPLANNGGQTDSRSLQNGSPAINAGKDCVTNGTCFQPWNTPRINLIFDQRINHDRKTGSAVDIGAFESGSEASIGLGYIAGTFSSNIGRRINAPTVLTNTHTGEKTFGFIRYSGGFVVAVRNDTIYIFEVKNKSKIGYSIRVFEFFDLF